MAFQLPIRSFISRHRKYRQSEYRKNIIYSKAFKSCAANYFPPNLESLSSIVLVMAKPNFPFGVNFEVQNVAENDDSEQ